MIEILGKHKQDCSCVFCRCIRKEKHKEGCQCAPCRARKGEMKDENHPSYGKHRTLETRNRMREARVGKHLSSETKEKMRRSRQLLWQTNEYVQKQMRSRDHTKQNEAEKLLGSLLPPSFRFVGDGQVIISGKCPDFINNEKHLIIELFGDYWHTPDEVEPRIKLFESQGYRTLVIWEHELMDVDFLVERISKWIFCNIRDSDP